MISGDDNSGYSLECNKCNYLIEDFSSFQDAVDYKKDRDNEWKSIKDEGGNWLDLCPDCSEIYRAPGLF